MLSYLLSVIYEILLEICYFYSFFPKLITEVFGYVLISIRHMFIRSDRFIICDKLFTGRHMEWELVASWRATAEDKGGLISHTRNPTLAMNGRSHLLALPMQKALFLRKCRLIFIFVVLCIIHYFQFFFYWKLLHNYWHVQHCWLVKRYRGKAAQLRYQKMCSSSADQEWKEDCSFRTKRWLFELHWRKCEHCCFFIVFFLI